MKNYTGKIAGLMLAMLIAMVTLMSSCKDDDPEPDGGSDLTITAINPATARIGEQVTITGTGFNPDYSQNEVKFYAGDDFTGGEATKIYETATPIAGTATSLVVEVPAKAQDGHIIVIANGEALESSMDFVVDVSLDNPVLTSLSPTNGFPGAVVVITGENFGEGIEAIEVKFGETVATVSAVTATTITTAVPEGMTEGEVQVSVSREGTAADKTLSYTVNKIPVDVKTSYWTSPEGIYRGVITESGADITLLYDAEEHPNAGNARGIDIDFENGEIYFGTGNGIAKVAIDGEGAVEFVYEHSETGYGAYDIALDLENRKLYATGKEGGSMYHVLAGSMDGTDALEPLYSFESVLNWETWETEGAIPQSIKLYVNDGQLYWTTATPSDIAVVKGSTDGSTDHEVLFDDTDGLVGPKGLAFDPVNEKIYISDNGNSLGATSNIFVGNLDGSGTLTTVVEPGDNVAGPLDMEIDLENGYIFWVNSQFDENPSELMRASIDGSTVEPLFDDLGSVNYFDLEIGEVLPE